MALKLPKWLFVLTGVGAAAGGLALIKEGKGEYYAEEERIAGKTVIITGANTGLGKEAAINLSNRGGRIILACRDMGKCNTTRDEIIEKTFNKNVHCRKLDLASFESIREFAKQINLEEKHVEVLINNAAVMCPPKSHTKEGIELQMGVNYFGHYLLTDLLLDNLKRSSPSRVVNVVSFPHRNVKINFRDLNAAKDYVAKDVYMQSKLALYMFTQELAEKLKGTNVSTYAVYPGLSSNTELGRHMGMNKSIISKTILGPLWWLTFRKPVKAIQTIVYCAVEPSIADQSGLFWRDMKTREYPSINEEDFKRLWAVSEYWTKPEISDKTE